MGGTEEAEEKDERQEHPHIVRLPKKHNLFFDKNRFIILKETSIKQIIKIKDLEIETRNKLASELILYEIFTDLKESKIYCQKIWDEIRIKYFAKINYDNYLKLQEEENTETQKENIKEITKKYDNETDEVEALKKEILSLMYEKKRSKATEILTNIFLQKEKIYTTRDDENSEMWIYKEGIYIPQAKTYIREFCRKVFDFTYTTTLVNEVISKIEAETYIEQQEFFKIRDPYIIAVKNGVINLKTKELLNYSPDYFLFNKLNINYDKEKDCPMIKKFFKEIFIEESDIYLMQELFGFCMIKDYKYEKAFMFNGTGRNGKGKTVELLKRFLTPDNCASIPLQDFEKDQYAKGELMNKLANIGADLNTESLKHTGDFKTLTGHDFVTVNRKFKTRVSFVNYAKMIFCCNELPMTYDTSFAFFNRWILVDFPFKFVNEVEKQSLSKEELRFVKERDDNIIEKISTDEEMQGLLNWALEGLQNLLSRNSFSYNLTTNQVSLQWIRKSNSLAGFCINFIEIDGDSKIKKNDFRRAYVNYCKEHKIKVLGDKSIKEYLQRELGVYEDRYRQNFQDIFYWGGIKFINSEETKMNGEDGVCFSTLREIVHFPIGKKTVPILPVKISPSLVDNNFVSKFEVKEEQIGQETEKEGQIELLENWFKFYPKNNVKQFSELFGIEKAEKWLLEGFILEMPSGTYILNK